MMITRESIAEKLGFDPIDHDFHTPAYERDWETEDEKKFKLLSIEELDFLIELSLAEAAKKKVADSAAA